MKSLKKLAVIGAVISAMNFAKADQKEVTFMPTDFEGGQIDKIELVNGQLLVRSNGKIDGVKTPYSYVGTNTQNFASSAFAQGGLTNVNQYVHAGNGKIYMTEKNNNSDVWTTSVSNKPALNGVSSKIEKANIEEDIAAKSMLNAAVNGLVTTTNDGDVYSLVKDSDKFYVYKNGKKTLNFISGTGVDESTPEAMVVVDLDCGLKMPYILARDVNGIGRIYTIDNNKILNKIAADSISLTSDGKKLLVTSGSNISIIDPNESSHSKNSVATASIPSEAKSVVVAGNNIYYATAKKLGYKTME